MTITIKEKVRCFGGWLFRCSHVSTAVGNLEMKFSVYLPEGATTTSKVPYILFLSGLTCSDENFVVKAGAFRQANAEKIALVCPDTSPRGAGIPGEDDSWDLGSGAGFYMDATANGWNKNYKMYTYVVSEFPSVVEANFPLQPGVVSISGHSMGGYGALMIALNNPGKYRSVSAFAPIAAPMESPWVIKACTEYLGNDKEQWKKYDTQYLLGNYVGPDLNYLVDFGTEDGFNEVQLKPTLMLASFLSKKMALTYRMQAGYDHSYFLISTFIDDHIKHHSKFLWKQ